MSKFYLNGYARFTREARIFAVCSALSSRVPEGFQLSLMEDNRVAVRYDELWGVATKEMKWVVSVSDDVYESLARAVTGDECRPGMLKDEVIRAAHASYHFIWRRVLEPASNLPWRLCRGDLDENIDEIASLSVPPSEPCSRHMWHLIQEEFSRDQLKLVLELLGECPWSSLPAEQQHASVSLLHRWHPEYGVESLVCRSLMHQMVRILPQTSKVDKHISRVIKKLQRLSNKVPEKASGSHMLVQALVRVVKGRKDGPK